MSFRNIIYGGFMKKQIQASRLLCFMMTILLFLAIAPETFAATNLSDTDKKDVKVDKLENKNINGESSIKSEDEVSSFDDDKNAEDSGSDKDKTVENEKLPEDINKDEEADGKELKSIVSFNELEAKSFNVGTDKSSIIKSLPNEITGLDENGEKVVIQNVIWNSDAYKQNKAGNYVFYATVNNFEEQGYILSENIKLPRINVELKKLKTLIKGVKDKYTKKANKSISFNLNIVNSGKRKVSLYKKSGKSWKHIKEYKTLSKTNYGLKITLPRNWSDQINNRYRVSLVGNDFYEGKAVYFNTKAIRVFQNSKRYYQLLNFIPKRKSGYNLKIGMSGYKVYKVRRKFNMGGANICSYLYTSCVAKKVKKFQRKHGLKATGKVNLETWRKLGFSKSSWYYLDSYVSPIKITPRSTKNQCIKAFIKTARHYLGTKYVWCAAAKKKQGIDCAGLVIQSLYSCGIDPIPHGSHVYAYKSHQYTTSRMWKNKKFKHVSFGNRKAGDIICYHGHVAIYIGNGRMIEALPGGVRISYVRGNARGCLRPFA